MDEIPEGFEVYVDEDGDQMWIDTCGDRVYVGPGGVSEPEPGWRPLYIGPPPKPDTLEEKVAALADRFQRAGNAAMNDAAVDAWHDAAKALRGLLCADDQ